MKREIYNLVVSQESILVWGVGTHTQRLLKCGILAKCNIVGFIDSNSHYQGGNFNGIVVMAPENVGKFKNRILISSYSAQNEIIHFARSVLNIKNEFITLY